MADKTYQTNNEYDLDLSKVDNDEHVKLANKINEFYNTDSNLKSQLSYNWERNQLMLDGKQWLVRSKNQNNGGTWSELKPSPQNQYIPRPVTNYLLDVYQTLKSYLTQHRPRSVVKPNTQSYTDKKAAKIAELVLETNFERLKEKSNYEYAAACLITYGTVFKKKYWDTSVLTKAKIPRFEEQPIFDPMTGQITGYQNKEVVDPETNEVIYDEIPLGDVNTGIVEPFRVALDPIANDIHDARWIMEYDIKPIDIVKQLYMSDEEGYTGEAENLKPEKDLSDSLRRFYELKTSSGVSGMGNTFQGTDGSSGPAGMIENAVVLKEYYERPSEKYPDGRLIVVANEKVLYVGPSPIKGPDLGDWHPYSECRWEIVPGRFSGKSPLDDAVELQKRLNSIDAAIILTRKTMAIPQKLVPKTSGIREGEWTGRPGQIIQYREGGMNKPEIVPPVGVDSSVWNEREQIIQDIKNITGAIDILKGDRPPGVTAASALEMLYEVGTGKLRPAMERWKEFIENDQKKELRLVAEYFKEPREDFIRLMLSKNTDLSPEDVKNFIGADLYDNCNVVIEAGSTIPKLESTRKAQLLEAAQTGALQLEVPENRMQFLEDLGITGYSQDISPDVKRAEWENDLIRDIKSQPDRRPVVLFNDEHQMHIEIHGRAMKEPAFMDLDPEVQQLYMSHIQEHQDYLDQAQQQKQMEAMITNTPMEQNPDINAQQNLDNRGKGIPAGTAEKILEADIPKRG